MPEASELARLKGAGLNNAVKCDFSTYFNLSCELNLNLSLKRLQEKASEWCDAIVGAFETKAAAGCNQTKLQRRRAFLPPDTEGTAVLLLKHTRKRYNPPRCTFTPWLGLPNDARAKGRVPLQRLESKE